MPKTVLSRLSSKGQVTLPRKVREAIGVRPGEAVAFDISKRVVRLRRAEPLDIAFHAALERAFDEWASPEDDEAFGDLCLGRSSSSRSRSPIDRRPKGARLSS